MKLHKRDPDPAVEQIEINELLEGIHKRYGYDFSHYSPASLKRRLQIILDRSHLSGYPQLLDNLIRDQELFEDFLRQMSINVTEMFRDPDFYKAIRDKVIPVLKTYPFIKIWHAGCATGEEVYSMAILLEEENFLSKAQIYATDFNKSALDIAENGIYSSEKAAKFAANYEAFGGKRNFSDYYTAKYDLIKFTDALKDRITFSYHNLVSDGVFGEMHLICCRNVLIYFDNHLQDHVLGLFQDSLRYGGFLGLGNKESLNFSAVRAHFQPVDKKQRIYQKKGIF